MHPHRQIGTSDVIRSDLMCRAGKKEVQVVRAVFAYEAQRPDELAFDEGEIL